MPCDCGTGKAVIDHGAGRIRADGRGRGAHVGIAPCMSGSSRRSPMSRPGAGCRLRHRRPAGRAAPRRPDLTLVGLEWADSRRARAGTNPARRSCAAASTPCRSPPPASTRSSPPTCCAMRRSIRPRRWRIWSRPAARRAAGGQHARLSWLLSAHDRRVHNARRLTARQTAAHAAIEPGLAASGHAIGTASCCPLMVVQRKTAGADSRLRRCPVSAMA